MINFAGRVITALCYMKTEIFQTPPIRPRRLARNLRKKYNSRMKTFKELLEQTKKSISEVNVDQARQLLGKGGVLFLDVREPQEYEEGIVRGAYKLPRGLLELQIEKAVPERDREIVVYCAGGARSALAAKSLLEMGYGNVKSMTGGFTVWEAAGYEIEMPSGPQSEG